MKGYDFMLFDERELNVLENNESRIYFKEILQTYYGQNYCATIVLLYSFVIYDLFVKLQTMANEGDKKAKIKLDEINIMIADVGKYSSVENSIIEFFKTNCPLYFDKFIEDIEYLKNCRNKCAHLKVNDNSLYVPSDYQARMLICSMYDNILSVKAPFITDLFSFVQNDVEYYTSRIYSISNDGLDEIIYNDLKNKYFKRMTYDSIKKSYRTFIKLLFVSDDKNCEENAHGLYVFSYALTEYIIKNGYHQIFNESIITDIFSRIEVNILERSSSKRNSLFSMMVHFPLVMGLIRVGNENIFEFAVQRVLLTPQGLESYRKFYPRSKKSIFIFFCENDKLKDPRYTETLYQVLKDCNDFDINKFMKHIVMHIPTFSGFTDADCFMESFISHITEMTINGVEEVLKIYDDNSQCVNRGRHSSDMKKVNEYLKEQRTKRND